MFFALPPPKMWKRTTASFIRRSTQIVYSWGRPTLFWRFQSDSSLLFTYMVNRWAGGVPQGSDFFFALLLLLWLWELRCIILLDSCHLFCAKQSNVFAYTQHRKKAEMCGLNVVGSGLGIWCKLYSMSTSRNGPIVVSSLPKPWRKL